MRAPLKTVLLSMLSVAIVYMVAIAITNLVQFSVEWLTELDRIISAEFFATLAGLALAAASFLSGSVNDIRNQLMELEEGADTKIKEAGRGNCAEGETWLSENPGATDDEIDATDFPSPVQVYLRALRKKNRADSNFRNIVNSKDAIVYSFFCFLFGLLEAITIDLWSKTSSKKAEEATGWYDSLMSNIDANLGIVLDVILSSGFLIAGLYFLAVGARGLLSNKG